MADRDASVPLAHSEDLAGLLARWMPGQRWFAGKGHSVTEVVVSDVSRLPLREASPAGVESEVAGPADLRGLPDVLQLIVGVHVDDAWQTYQIPVCVYSQDLADPVGPRVRVGELADGSVVVDALSDPVGMTALLREPADDPVLDPEQTHGHEPEPGAARPPSFEAARIDPAWLRLPPRRLSVEQSNTSVVLGENAMMKVFRRLVPGINPDIEVHAALGGNRHLGRCLGWVNGGWHDPVDGTWRTSHLAMVQELHRPAIDGWDLACQRVGAGESFAAEARALGAATASVHADLRRVFPVERLDADGRARLVSRLLDRLAVSAGLVPEVADLAPGLRRRIEAVADVVAEVEVQRVHGDFHLGQVLLASDGWKLLDFEGEPGSQVAASTAADHALRDIAGMIRSFAYAGAQGGGKRPPDEVAAWCAECESEFLAGYSSRSPGGTAGALTDDERTILSAYLVDKAAYEARYERAHRPDWLPIPLDALADLAAQ